MVNSNKLTKYKMKSQSYFSGSFGLFKNKIKELAPYLLTLAVLNFLNEFLSLKIGVSAFSFVLSLVFSLLIFLVSITLIKTTLHLLRNEETSPNANIDFFKKHSKEFLNTVGKYLLKFLKIAGIPLAILIIVGIVFVTCSTGTNGFPYPTELMENLFAGKKAALTGPCTIGFYLSTLLAQISFMIFIVLAVIATVKLFFTWYSFADHKTKITDDHTKISDELTKGRKGEFIIFLIFAAFGFAILAFVAVAIIQAILPSKILDIAVNSLGMAVFTVLYSAFFGQYYLTLKEKDTAK